MTTRHGQLTILARRGPVYANIFPVRDGVAVVIARSDRPAGQRKIGEGVFDVPMHVVLDRVHDLIGGA
jgi:hypothetical protein